MFFFSQQRWNPKRDTGPEMGITEWQEEEEKGGGGTGGKSCTKKWNSKKWDSWGLQTGTRKI